jgi:hypothetical protein
MNNRKTQVDSTAAANFSLPSFTAGQLNCGIALDLALCIGLLTQNGDSYSINTDWFSDPGTELLDFPTRAEPLIDLVNQLFNEAFPNPVTINGQNWYPISDGDLKTDLFAVVPPTPAQQPASGSQVVALGWRPDPLTKDSVTASASAVVPIFALPNDSAEDAFVLGQTGYPIVLTLDVATSKLTGVPNRVVLTGNFTFSEAPTFSIQVFQSSTLKFSYTSLEQLLNDVTNFKTVINAILGVDDVNAFLANPIGSSTGTLGGMLSSPQLGFLTPSGPTGPYTLADLSSFTKLTPLQVATNLFFAILNVLAADKDPIISFPAPKKDSSQKDADPPKCGIWIASRHGKTAGTEYGVRMVVPPITLIPGSGGKAGLTLQLGKWLTGEEKGKKNSWYYRADPTATEPAPGISFYFINAVTTNGMTSVGFTGSLEMVSFGFDYSGTSANPLISYGASEGGGESSSGSKSPSFSLVGCEVRGYLSLDFTETPLVRGWGGTMRLDNIGLPLGNSVNAGGVDNPVAASVLAAGSKPGGSDPQSSQPVNPTFSLAASYLNGTKLSPPFDIQLYQADGKPATPSSPVWFPAQKSFGPINLTKLGINWDNPNLQLDLDVDGGVTVGPLQIDLDNLQVRIPVETPLDPSKYGLGLDGLAVSLDAGSVALSGGLMHSGDQYIGEATITAGTFTIAAVGAFGRTTDGATSLFVYGFLNTPLGGPPAFYVTGVAAGFGYNRQLIMPPQDQVSKFPLVAMALNGSGSSPGSVLQNLIDQNCVPSMRGENWVAIGINWTSFEVIKTTAMLAVQFGKELEIDILGVTTLILGAGSSPYVNLVLDIEATIKPAEGTALITGILDNSSYVIDPSCHVTGGFAFGSWYGDNEHSGDFVLTVGGYHPSFYPPPWYPQVPRVGLNWNYSSNIVIAGDAYFALTPIAAMAGCGIDVTYSAGDLRAWLTAKADALIQWKPFFYDFDISISVGVSYKLDLLVTSVTLEVELGAGFEIWGPQTGGNVYIDWYIISFSIPFGADKNPPTLNEWKEFVALLPTPTTAGRQDALHEKVRPAADPTPSNLSLQALITGGNLTQNADKSWNVRADGLALTVRSPMPTTQFVFKAGPFSSSPTPGATAFGMWQIGLSNTETKFEVTIENTKAGKFNDNANWIVTVSSQGMPTAMWGVAGPSLNSPTTASLDIGLAITAAPMVAAGPPAIPIINLDYSTIVNKPLPGAIAVPAASAQQISTQPTLPLVNQYLQDSAAIALRTEVLAALAGFGYDTGFDTPTPAGLAGVSPSGPSNVYVEFRGEVMLGTPAGTAWPAQ